jgi:beta-lactamase class A
MRFALPFVLLASIVLGASSSQRPGSAVQTVPPNDPARQWLAQRVFMPDGNDFIINLQPLRTAMRAHVAAADDRLGVYFEYLPTGGSIGINQDYRYFAASLLKVPIVIQAYLSRERGLLSFDDPLVLQEEDLDRRFGVMWREGAGATLTVRQAVRAVLVDSDNTALAALQRHLTTRHVAFLDEAFDYLDIPKELVSREAVVSPKNYSSVLRSLYLAVALPPASASEMLSLLSASSFSNGLRAGVPGTVRVAHKMGVYEAVAEEPTISDCGIVYVPKRPFLMCVMVQADALDEAARHIEDLTRLAYEFVVDDSR